MAACRRIISATAPIRRTRPGKGPAGPKPPGERKGARMTAKHVGRNAVSGLWLMLKRLRENWILIAFVATVLYGARDVHDEALLLTERVKNLYSATEELRTGMARLEAGSQGRWSIIARRWRFRGLLHAATDGRPGEWVMARFRPVHALRPECQAAGMAAYMIDTDRRWFSVQTDLAGWPSVDSLEELAFGVDGPSQDGRGARPALDSGCSRLWRCVAGGQLASLAVPRAWCADALTRTWPGRTLCRPGIFPQPPVDLLHCSLPDCARRSPSRSLYLEIQLNRLLCTASRL